MLALACALAVALGAAAIGQQPDPVRSREQKATPKSTTKAPTSDQNKQEPRKTPTSSSSAKTTANDISLPGRMDPADIRGGLSVSVHKMLEADRHLARLRKERKLADSGRFLSFDRLTNWRYVNGLEGMPKAIRKLDGKKVLMTGFMLPIDELKNLREVLLVDSLWACSYAQPPHLNGVVRVVMPKGKTTDLTVEPLKILGTFHVAATVIDGYCVDIYQLHVESLAELK